MNEASGDALQNLSSNLSTSSRACCARCARPLATCFCAFIVPIENQVEVIILQHPDEQHEAKNTAGLLQLSLRRQQLWVGEQFTDAQLQQVLFADQRQPLLLYPELADYRALGLTPPPPCPPLAELPLTSLRLIVLDATWRKSRKMLYLNPRLQQVPLLSLNTIPASIYKIRKAHSQNQLSTLEASCYALMQLEQQQVDYQPLLGAMRQFVAQLAAFNPHFSR